MGWEKGDTKSKLKSLFQKVADLIKVADFVFQKLEQFNKMTDLGEKVPKIQT